MQKPARYGYDLLQAECIEDKVHRLLAEQRRSLEQLLAQQQISVARLVADQHAAVEQILTSTRAKDMPSSCQPLASTSNIGHHKRGWSDSFSDMSTEDSLKLHLDYQPSSLELLKANNRCQDVLLPIVQASWFRLIMSGVVIANTIFLGMRVHWEMTNILSTGHVDPKAQRVFDAFHLAFFVLFTMEMAIRLAAEQREFFCRPGKSWNIFEVVCLFSMAIDIIDPAEAFSEVIGGISALRLLGLFRILRAVRAVRIFQFMKQLRLMLLSVVSCLFSMMWAILLLFLIICLFALFLEDSALAHLKELKGNQTALDPVVTSLSDNWNGMFQAMVSLIYSISGGADWGDLAEPFWMLPFCGIAYMMFVILTIFGLLNVLVGIFVQEASEVTKSDKDFVVDAFLQKRKEKTQEISDLFDIMDLEKTGWISYEEMSKALQKDNIAAYFEHLEVEVSKVEVLFQVLDSNGDGTISKDEFMQGLRKLNGHANATDVADMLIEEQKMNKKLDTLGTLICQRIDSLQGDIASRKTGFR